MKSKISDDQTDIFNLHFFIAIQIISTATLYKDIDHFERMIDLLDLDERRDLWKNCIDSRVGMNLRSQDYTHN